MLLKDFRIERPKTTKIQAKGGKKYVYQVVESIYDPIKKYNVDKRVCIGRMLDDVIMIPNEKFMDFYPELVVSEIEQPQFSDTLKIGTFIMIQKIFNDLKIDELLKTIFEEDYAFIIDLVSYIITNESATFQYYPSFMRNHPIYSESIRSDSYISRFIRDNIDDDNIKLFLDGWNSFNSQCESIYIDYDSTNMNTSAEGIELAEYGHAKVDEDLPQVNLSYAVNHETSVPLFYELYAGSIIDNSQCKHMVEQARDYGYKNIGFILDRGYFCGENIRFFDENGFDFILMMKNNQAKVQKVIDDVRYELKTMSRHYIAEYGVCGMTKEDCLYERDKKKRYFHIFYDDIRASTERKNLLDVYNVYEKELEKKIDKKLVKEMELKKYKKAFILKYDKNGYFLSFKRNNDFIQNQLDHLGFFVIMTSEEMEASRVLDIYRNRDNIEKLFRSLKSGVDFNKYRVHSEESLKSKTFITFLAMIVRNEIFQKTKEIRKENKKDYTVPGIISELENIECTKNTNDKYMRRYAMTAKQKKILKQFEIDEKYVDRRISDFNSH